MKNLHLSVEEHLYETLLAMLKGLPKEDITIIEDSSLPSKTNRDINQFSGAIKSFEKITDPVEWQKNIRSEWDRNTDI